MKRRLFIIHTGLVCLLIGLAACPARAAERTAPKVLRDLFWVWDTPRRSTPGEHTAATFAQATGAEKAKLLGTPNIVMAGAGLPSDEQQADAWTGAVSHCPRIIWEICPDGTDNGEVKPPFVYEKRIALIGKLAAKYPQIEGVLLDDMSSVGINHGFAPEHVKNIRAMLDDKCPAVKIWGVLYTMNFERDGVVPIVQETDVINLWVWHAKDLVNLEEYVAHCEKTFPDKPIVLGLYLRDYGDGKPMTKENMELQCETARKLAHEGRIKGIVFLTIDNDEEIVRWTADWIERVGDERIGAPANIERTATPAAGASIRLVSETAESTRPEPIDVSAKKE